MIKNSNLKYLKADTLQMLCHFSSFLGEEEKERDLSKKKRKNLKKDGRDSLPPRKYCIAYVDNYPSRRNPMKYSIHPITIVLSCFWCFSR